MFWTRISWRVFLALAALACAPDSSGGGRWADGRREQHAGLSYGTSRALYGETAAPLAPQPMWSNSSAAERRRGSEGRGTFAVEKMTLHLFMGGGQGMFEFLSINKTHL